MPPKKKAKKIRSTKTSSASAVAVHATVGQKIGIAVALLAGFAAIAAGFAAIPRGERPSSDDGRAPAYNEQRQAQRAPAQEKARRPERKKAFFGLFSVKDKSEGDKRENSDYGDLKKPETEQKSYALKAAPVVDIQYNETLFPINNFYRTGQKDAELLSLSFTAQGESFMIDRLNFRLESLVNKPVSLNEVFQEVRLTENGIDAPIMTAIVNNGNITFENLGVKLEKDDKLTLQLNADVLSFLEMDGEALGKPFKISLDDAFTTPKITGIESGSQAEIEGVWDSTPKEVRRVRLSTSWASGIGGYITPEGFVAKSAEQIIAVLDFANWSEDGYEATLKKFAMDINHTVQGSGDTTIKIYKHTIDNSNLLATKETYWKDINGMVVFSDSEFTDFELAPMANTLLYVTMDTSDSNINASTSLCVNQNKYVEWSDGAKTYSSLMAIGSASKCMMY